MMVVVTEVDPVTFRNEDSETRLCAVGSSTGRLTPHFEPLTSSCTNLSPVMPYALRINKTPLPTLPFHAFPGCAWTGAHSARSPAAKSHCSLVY